MCVSLSFFPRDNPHNFMFLKTIPRLFSYYYIRFAAWISVCWVCWILTLLFLLGLPNHSAFLGPLLQKVRSVCNSLNMFRSCRKIHGPLNLGLRALDNYHSSRRNKGKHSLKISKLRVFPILQVSFFSQEMFAHFPSHTKQICVGSGHWSFLQP